MYLINGIDPEAVLGVELQATSSIIGSRAARRSSPRIPGRNGNVKSKATVTGEPIVLVFIAPVEKFAQLCAILESPDIEVARSSAPDVILDCEWKSTGHQELLFADLIKVTFLLDVPGVYFRDRNPSDWAIVGASSALSESTAPVQDALIRIAGSGAPVSVTSREHSITYPANLPAGSFLRVDTATGRAWVTPTDTWSGGAEVSSAVNISPGFVLLPDPITQAAPVTATGGVAVVRGRRAYGY